MDTIKTTIELGGITMTCIGDKGTIAVERGCNALKTYDTNYWNSSFSYSPFNLSFYIECKDDPSKLHKFCEMKYLGLVDNPHYQKVGDLLREMVKKFDGCVVVVDKEGAYLVTKKTVVKLGCAEGVAQVIGKVLIGIGDPYVSQATAFNRIDASRIPNVWAWPSTYDKDIRAMCEQLKDVEP